MLDAGHLGRAAIRAAHQRARQPDPTSDVAVVDFLKGTRRIELASDPYEAIERQAIPADAALVRDMLRAIDTADTGLANRDAALVATAYTTAARRGELADLVIGDADQDGAEYRLQIRRGKANQWG